MWFTAHPSIISDVYDELKRGIDLEGLVEQLTLTAAPVTDESALSRLQLRGSDAAQVLSMLVHRSMQHSFSSDDDDDDDDMLLHHRSLYKLLAAKNLRK